MKQNTIFIRSLTPKSKQLKRLVYLLNCESDNMSYVINMSNENAWSLWSLSRYTEKRVNSSAARRRWDQHPVASPVCLTSWLSQPVSHFMIISACVSHFMTVSACASHFMTISAYVSHFITISACVSHFMAISACVSHFMAISACVSHFMAI